VRVPGRHAGRISGFPLCFDDSRARAELDVVFRPVHESVVEHLQQMVGDGLA
jgi:dihydroflavonol-4-reductase